LSSGKPRGANSIPEPATRSFDGAGDEYFSLARLRGDARADVDGEPRELAVDEVAFAGVDSDPDP
jgi:hypothetical protein